MYHVSGDEEVRFRKNGKQRLETLLSWSDRAYKAGMKPDAGFIT